MSVYYYTLAAFIAGPLILESNSWALEIPEPQEYNNISNFKSASGKYWTKINEFSKERRKSTREGKPVTLEHFVLVHPPIYVGPKPEAVPVPKKKKKITDYVRFPLPKNLRKSIKDQFGLEIEQVPETLYKAAFTKEAKHAGFTVDEILVMYGLETGGRGPYDLVSGEGIKMDGCKVVKRKGGPASTAIGYAQLLRENTMFTFYKNVTGKPEIRFIERLRKKAEALPISEKEALLTKLETFEKMADTVKSRVEATSGSHAWAKTYKVSFSKLGNAVHALNMDPDIGPMIQVGKIKTTKNAAKRAKLEDFTPEKFEFMNLVGWPRGVRALKGIAIKVPTANFMNQREINSNAAVLKNKTIKQSYQFIAEFAKKKKSTCGSDEFRKLWNQT